MKIFCSISTAGRSLLPAALFGAVLISLAAAVLVFQMRREKMAAGVEHDRLFASVRVAERGFFENRQAG